MALLALSGQCVRAVPIVRVLWAVGLRSNEDTPDPMLVFVFGPGIRIAALRRGSIRDRQLGRSLSLAFRTHYRPDEGAFGMMSKYRLFSHTQSSSSVSATNSQENRAVHGFLYAFASSIVT